jgi:hypothetical protein
MSLNEKVPASKIKTEEYYSATRIIKSGWFPWIKSSMTFLQMLRSEDKAMKLYKPVVRQKGQQTRYLIKGETILSIIKKSEEGKLEI